MGVWAAPAAAQDSLPPEVTDGMYITLDEVRANSERVFGALAGESGGPIPKQRFVAAEVPADVLPSSSDRELLGKLFEQLDASGDDSLTRQEWQDRINRDLDFADANSDGKITLKELAKARENMSVGDALGLVF